MAGAKTHFNRTGTSILADFKYGYGVPIGNLLYVNSAGSGSTSAGPGRTPENAYSSIQNALSGVTADNGDVLLVCNSHVETLTAASAVNITTSYNGVTVRGLGAGRQRPQINYTTAVGASFDVSGNRVVLEELYFTVGFDAITAMLNISGTDCTIRRCSFELATASFQATLGILATLAATRLTIEDCDFYGTADAGTTNAIQFGATGNVRIRRCRFHGAYATGSGAIQNTAAAVDCFVESCDINNLTGTCTKAMIFHASTTGQIARTNMQILSGTAPITGAAMSWVGQNAYAATIATGASAV